MKPLKLPKWPKSNVTIFFILLLFIPLIAYFLVYVPHQQTRFHKRNLRVLKDLSSQIQSKVHNLSNLMHNAAANSLQQMQADSSNAASFQNYIRRNTSLIPDIQIMESVIDPFTVTHRNINFISQNNSEFRMTAYTRRETDAFQLHFIYEGHFFNDSPVSIKIHAKVNLADMLQSMLNREIYDNVLIMDQSGQVIYQRGGSEFLATRLDSLMDQKNAAVNASSLQYSSRMLKLKFADVTYRSYFQPLPFFFTQPSDNGRPIEWTLCALVDSARFRKESMAISYNFIIIFIFLVLFSSISWPLLKLWKMGMHDRYRFADVIFLFLFLIVGTSLISISLMDAQYYLTLRFQFDRQLKEFSQSVSDHFRDETSRAINLLQFLDHSQIQQGRKAPVLQYSILSTNQIPDSLYTNFEMVFWCDATGMQQSKWSVRDVATPLINVSKREYFQKIAMDQGWYWPDKSLISNRQQYWIEPIYSWTTGENEAIISIPSTFRPMPGDNIVMAALVFRPLSVINTVIPEGFGYCVIDENGNTLFHSDARRNLRENFLRECNYKRLLQGAIFGRESTLIDLNYSGTELRVFVQPIADTKWSLVTFRHKDFMRSTNLETLTVSLSLFILFVLSLLLMLGIFRILFPQYNIDWFWPHVELVGSYYQLTMLYGILSLLYLVAIFQTSPTQMLVITMIIPNFVILLTYIKLKLDQQISENPAVDSIRFRFHAVRWRGTKAYVLLGALILLPIIFHALIKHTSWPLAAGQSLGLLVVTWAVLSLPTYHRLHRFIAFSYRAWYMTALVFLLVLVSVLPSIALFHIVSNQESRLMLKNVQYDLGKQLESRQERIRKNLQAIAFSTAKETTVMKDRTRIRGALDMYYQFFFNTHLDSMKAADYDAFIMKQPEDDLLRTFRNLESLVRFSYDSVSIQTRALMDHKADDNRWESAISSPSGLHFLYRAKTGAILHVSSRIPSTIFTRKPYWIIGFIVLIIIVLVVIRGIANRIIFLDFYQPDFYQPHYMVVKDLQTYLFDRNLLLITPPIAGKSDLLLSRDDIKVISLTRESPKKDWADHYNFNKLPDDPKQAIVLDHFDFELDNSELNHQRVQFLEKLIYEHRRTVVLISTVDLNYYFSSDPDNYERLHPDANQPDDWIRWSRILSRFEKIYVEDIGNQVEHQKTVEAFIAKATENSSSLPAAEQQSRKQLYELFERECKPNSNMQQVGREIVNQLDIARLDPEQLIHEIMQRAKSYFQVLWGTCSRDERLALIHLAEDGLVTSTNAPVVRRLLQRNLVFLDTTVKLMNESFRRFILSTYRLKDVEPEGQESSWNTLKRPLVFILIVMLTFLFFTQQEFLNDSIALVSAITALLPAIVRIIGLFPEQITKSRGES
ncbi:cache domain-containing protein [candidate division KSB1 bacterium]|nr:cache domain-containing protein [candidate division KSB1 bacterium]